MQNENSACRNEVKTVLKQKMPDTILGARALSGVVRSMAARLEKGFSCAEYLLEKNTHENYSVCEWLCDNRYVFEKNLELVKKSIKGKQRYTVSCDGKPRYYHAFFEFYRCFDEELSAEKIMEFSSVITEEKPYPTLYDLYSLETLMRVAVLECVGDVCKRLENGNLKQSDAQEIEKAVLSLKNIESFSFERVFENNPTEKVLELDPSGFYPTMTKQTKREYRQALYHLATKSRLDEQKYAQEIIEKCKKAHIDREKHVGFYLLGENKSYGKLYFVLLFLSVGFTELLLFFVHPAMLLSLFPVWEASKQILDRLFGIFAPKRSVPSLEISEVPDGSGVMCVITTLLTGGKGDEEIFDRLEKMYLSNGGRNIYFGVLADRTDSDTATVNTDEEILSSASKRIKNLRKKYSDVFFLFSRERRYSPSQKKFMAYERKRGAVNELCTYLCGKGDGFDDYSIKPDENLCNSIKYCITLDADTNLPLGSVLLMTGAMLHPLNRPEINRQRHVVTHGHAIMQPCVSTTLGSAGRTRFSRMMCGAGGTEIYSSARFDTEQSLFGNAVFCGKGIFDKNAFYEVMCENASLAHDTVLSHDSIEGARLNCACLSDVVLTDSFPKNELSYFKRAHRWIRGDVQNTVFLGKYVKNQSGEIISNSISPLYKFRIFDNVRRALVPVFTVLCAVAGVFLSEWQAGALMVAGFLHLFIQPAFDIVMSFFACSFEPAVRSFFSKGVQTGLWQSLSRSVLGTFSVAKNAIVTLDATLRSLYRMLVSRKSMLEWVTAAQTDEADRDGVIGYVYKNLASAILGVSLFVICPFGPVRLVGLLWFFHPVFAYYTSLSGKTQEKQLSQKERQKICEYARDIWRFFEENVTDEDSFLPIDNIQFFPDTIKAHRTSPTNIGLYLVCTLCAREFGFIDSKELYLRLCNTLNTLDKMKKWNGHLYNWYDTKSLEVLQPYFISGVDSGNLLACVLIVYEGLGSYTEEFNELEDVRTKLKSIYDSTLLLPLYDREKELFYIGVGFDENGNSVCSDNRYDLLMSEARTLSYIAAAKRDVPVKHWQSLSRMPVRAGDRMGLASWTGTAFEYFMPALFMPVPEGSLFYEALCFALREQKKRRANTENGQVWGISESAFFAFDYEMNYQYKAFGIPVLGLHRGLENDLVISPYSSFLALCVSTKSVLSNLERLKKSGMYGHYGFYEAADFTPRRVKSGFAKVKSVMSHHAGMSMAACANACFDNILQKRFMSNGKMGAAVELLEEKIPVDALVRTRRGVPERGNRPSGRQESAVKNFENVEKKEPVCSVLSDGKNRIILSSTGYISLYHNDLEINRADSENTAAGGLYVLCEIDGEVFSCHCSGFENKKASYGFGTSLGEVRYSANIVTRTGKRFVFEARFSLDGASGNVYRISAKLKPASRKTDVRVRFALCFEPVMMGKSAYEAHPAFAALFVESEYKKDENVLVFSRRKREDADRETFLGVGLCTGDAFEFSSQKKVLCPIPITYESYKGVFKADLSEKTTGACANPFCLVRTGYVRNSSLDTDFIMAFGYDRESVLMSLDLSRKKTFSECKKELSEKALHMLLGTKFYPEAGREITEEERLASACIYPERYEARADEKYKDDMLWRHGISGDVPLFAAFADTAYLCEKLERYIRAFMLLRLKGIKGEFALFCRDRDTYHKKSEMRIREMLERNGALGALGRKNGIFIVNIQSVSDKGSAILSRASLVIKPSISSSLSLYEKGASPVRKKEHEKKTCPQEAFFSGAGYFLPDGSYVANKAQMKRAYSHVLSGRLLSCVVDTHSLGYTFSRNAAERRITPFYNDEFVLESAEHVYAYRNGKAFDLCALSDNVRFFSGGAEYYGELSGERYTVSVCIPEKLPVKLICVKTGIKEARLSYEAKPIMGREKAENRRIAFEVRSGSVTFANMFPKFYDETGFLFGTEFSSDGAFCALSHAGFSDGKAMAYFELDGESEKCYVFALGSVNSEQTLDFVMSSVRNNYNQLLKSAYGFSGSFEVSQLLLKKNDSLSKSLELFFDKWLVYQNGACRFFARSGFYQSGGAFGFRDQLQDSLGLMYSHPEITRAHIIRCCAHQFEEGDVLHWWHPCTQDKTHSHMGVRTKISDDYVFLPYAVSEYIRFTGDLSVLDVKVRYISAPPLQEGENEKYIAPSHSQVSENVYRHCLRSLSRVCERTGEHGLCLIGAGDWCDGLNRIGIDGKGESVWLTMFVCMVLESFSKVCERYDDARCAFVMLERRKKLIDCIEKYGFDIESGYYLRAYTDSGRKIGVSSENENKIELLPQAFSVFARTGSVERRAKSLEKAFAYLYDKENHIMKLFSPAYVNPDYDAGYIKGYCEGFRENGGQYTHAAVWMMMSLMEMSLDKELCESDRSEFLKCGVQLMSDMLVPLRMRDEKLSVKYGAEPYVLSADIYSNPSHKGKGGWTWYTGSASWLWRALLEYCFCIRLCDVMTQSPVLKLSENVFTVPFMLMEKAAIKLCMPDGKTEVAVEYKQADERKVIYGDKECGMKIRLCKEKNIITVYSNQTFMR